MNTNTQQPRHHPLNEPAAPTLQTLQDHLGYQFTSPTLLLEAITHRSVSVRSNTTRITNERLEFLGDAVLAVIVSADLIRRHPDDPEGHLSKRRTQLVNTQSLAAIGRTHQLGRWLKMGRGESMTGGAERESLLANLVEAILGAAFLDGGLAAARSIYLTLSSSHTHPTALPTLTDHKSALQEFTAKHCKTNPIYRLDHVDGPDHAPIFTVSVIIGQMSVATGTGRKRKDAEKQAAQTALAHLESLPKRAISKPVLSTKATT